MAAFDLSEIQSDEVLETRLYKLAKLEILKIREELDDKRKRAKAIRAILKSEEKLWGVIREELEALAQTYADKRRTRIDETDLTEEFTRVVHRAGRRDGAGDPRRLDQRQRSVNLETTRMRDNDALLPDRRQHLRVDRAVLESRLGLRCASTTCRPRPHGTPVQKQFKFGTVSGRRRTGTDPRFMLEFASEKPVLGEEYEEPHPLHGRDYRVWRCASRCGHREPSTRTGRLFGKPGEATSSSTCSRSTPKTKSAR
jgi:DNA gyrase subunit A